MSPPCATSVSDFANPFSFTPAWLLLTLIKHSAKPGFAKEIII